MVISLSNLLDMDNLEVKSYSIILRLKKRNELRKQAAKIITIATKYGRIIKFRRKKLRELNQVKRTFIHKLKKHTNSFKKINRL